MTDRKKPTAGFWITVALVAVLVAYPLSFGPACWIGDIWPAAGERVVNLYAPLIRVAHWCAGDVGVEPLYWWGLVGASGEHEGETVSETCYKALSIDGAGNL